LERLLLYGGGEDNYFLFEEYLQEFSTKLKKNGIFIFSVPAPDHIIFNGAKNIDEKYTIVQNDPLEIRKGVVFRSFKSKDDIVSNLSEYFCDFHFGEIDDDLFGSRGHWYIGYCHKRS
jgi:hypothetical protein